MDIWLCVGTVTSVRRRLGYVERTVHTAGLEISDLHIDDNATVGPASCYTKTGAADD